MPRTSCHLLLSGLLACLLIVWSACAATANGSNDAAAEPVGREWDGLVSQQKQAFIQVVTTPEEWRALWKRALDQPAPVVDFQRHAVACVFLGHAAPWLFSISFDEPRTHGDTLVIPYSLAEMILELSGPFKAGGQYRMKVFARRDGYRMLLEETRFPQDDIRLK